MRKTKGGVTAERLRELVIYDKDTGIFRWRVDRFCGKHMHILTAKAGDVAGSTDEDGYHMLTIDAKRYQASRLAWVYVTGAWPEYDIDHIDTNPSNNRFANLRDVSPTVNLQNRKRAQRNNKVGLLGVSKRKTGGRKKWIAQIAFGGKHKYIGAFETPEEAHAAYLAAKRELHAGCTL